MHANNATSQLYKARKELSINFYSASNFDEILVNTPLGSISFESLFQNWGKLFINALKRGFLMIYSGPQLDSCCVIYANLIPSNINSR